MAVSKAKRIERLVTRIDRGFSSDEVRWIGRCPKKRINEAEAMLGVVFPNSYRAFLELKGGGGYENFYILGVPPKGKLGHGCDVVRYSAKFREDWVKCPLPQHFVPVEYDEDVSIPHCLDMSHTKRGECPVVAYVLANGHVELVAPDFVSFYEEYIGAFLAEEEK